MSFAHWKKTSRIVRLYPFLHEGLLFVGGRLAQSSYPDSMKYQRIIPQDSELARLVVLHEHHQTLHVGTTQAIAYIRSKFWIPSCRNPEIEAVQRVLKDQHQTSLQAEAAGLNLRWAFIPPRAMHFGGLWEAGVKSAKKHLRRIMGNRVLTFEELTTLLCQVECVLNSRPLCPISEVPNDADPLTPANFTKGGKLEGLPFEVTGTADEAKPTQPTKRRVTSTRDGAASM